VLNALWDLIDEGLVAEVDGEDGLEYVWRARWRGPRKRLKMRERHTPTRDSPGARPDDLDIEGETIRAFHEFVIRRYEPPADKPWLALFQCSVRRPFSKSPSHASMRRAIEMATGFDPAKRFHECPVHVVVLASRIGPVPYELEDFHPANVSGGGVKHFGDDVYAEVRPVLVARMAEFLTTHGNRYERAAAFGDSRYGEVMRDAAARAGIELPIFPRPDGPQVTRLGDAIPRTYWQKAWIQLCLEVMDWLPPAERRTATARLAAAGAEYG
jgi:predicted RNA-binding protein